MKTKAKLTKKVAPGHLVNKVGDGKNHEKAKPSKKAHKTAYTD
jgi:hypothetical protein